MEMADNVLNPEELGALRRQVSSLGTVARDAMSLATASRDTAPGLFSAGRIWELANVPRLAADMYERALRLDPNFNEAAARLAFARIRTGRAKEALELANDLATRAPDFQFKTITGSLTISSQTVLGDALRANGSKRPAIKAYEAAVQLVPGDSYSIGRLAELYLDQGRIAAAVRLEPNLDAKYFSGIKSALRLAQNDPTFLPTITRVRTTALINRDVCA